jgi:hypothetical protein
LMWIQDDAKQYEGVMVRKDRTEYLCRPQTLATSTFGVAMQTMNVSVCFSYIVGFEVRTLLTLHTGCYDHQLHSR